MRKLLIILTILMTAGIGFLKTADRAEAASAFAPSLLGVEETIIGENLLQNIHGWHCSWRRGHRHRGACGHRRYRSRRRHHERWRSDRDRDRRNRRNRRPCVRTLGVLVCP